MRLQGKKALVTGATSGIGAAIAQAFAREGAQVVITGRHAQRAQTVADTIHANAGSAHIVIADLTSDADLDRLIAQTYEAVGWLDILVNNAGIFPNMDTEKIDRALFDAVVATNLRARFFGPPHLHPAWPSAAREKSLISRPFWLTKAYQEALSTGQRKPH